MFSDEPTSCFDGCPPNLGQTGDTNGNNSIENTAISGKSPRKNDKYPSATLSECEKLVVNSPSGKSEEVCKRKFFFEIFVLL